MQLDVCYACRLSGVCDVPLFRHGRTIRTRFVFGVTAAFPLLIGLASLIVHEDRVEGPQPAGAIAPSSTTTTTSAATATLPADAGAPSGSTPHSQQLARQQPLAQQQHQQPSLAGALGTSARAAAAALSSRVATLSASAAAARAAASARGSAAWGAAAAQGGALWGALSAPAIAWPVAFLMLLSATPAADDGEGGGSEQCKQGVPWRGWGRAGGERTCCCGSTTGRSGGGSTVGVGTGMG